MGDLSQFKEVPKGYEPKEGDEVLVRAYIQKSAAGRPLLDTNCIDELNAIIAIRERPIEPECKVKIKLSERHNADDYGVGTVRFMTEHLAWVHFPYSTASEPNEDLFNIDGLERIS